MKDCHSTYKWIVTYICVVLKCKLCLKKQEVKRSFKKCSVAQRYLLFSLNLLINIEYTFVNWILKSCLGNSLYPFVLKHTTIINKLYLSYKCMLLAAVISYIEPHFAWLLMVWLSVITEILLFIQLTVQIFYTISTWWTYEPHVSTFL